MNPGSTTLTLSKKASCIANNADVIFFANSFGFVFNSEEIIKAKFVEKSPCEIFLGIDKDNLEKSSCENSLFSMRQFSIFSRIFF